MATSEQDQKARSELMAVLAILNEINADALGRAETLGELNFASGIPIFKRSLELYRDLSECNLDRIPFETLNSMKEHAGQLLNILTQIQKFSIAQHPQNPTQIRDSLIQQVRDRWHQDYAAVAPQIAFSIRQGTDFAALEREARGTVSLQNKIITELKTENEKILAEMKGALEKVRQAAAEAGVAQHATHFKTEADGHHTHSFIWLCSTVAFGAAMVAYAVFVLNWGREPSPTDLATMAQTFLPKITVLLVLGFGLIWAARNFASSRHSVVVNRHRQNALSSFETFVKGAGDVETKNAVLLQATQSIFAPQESGYTRSDNAPHPGSQIVEIIRSASSPRGS